MDKNLEIAKTIHEQIGKGAFFMMGAKNLIAIENGLAFKIGRNSKSINYIEITLNAWDTYDIKFGYLTVKGYKLRKEVEGIYFDMLHEIISRETGLALSFPKVVGLNC